MGLFDFNTGSGTQNTSVGTSLGNLNPDELVNRGLFMGAGNNQAAAFSQMLANEMKKLFGMPAVPAQAGGALNAQQMLPGIVGSQEFTNRLAGGDLGGVIGGAYQNILGRQAGQDEIANWIGTGQSGQQILQGILGSPEAQGRQLTPENLYMGILNRAPSEQELNQWRGVQGVQQSAPGQEGVPPQGTPIQGLADASLANLMARITGQAPIVSDVERAQLDKVYTHQRTRGLEDLDRTFSTAAQERGLNENTDSPIANQYMRTTADFLGNLSSQQAGAEMLLGQQNWQNAMGAMNLQANMLNNADRNRLALLVGTPGASGLMNQLLTQGQIASGSQNRSTTTSGTNTGVNVGADNVADVLKLGSGLVGPLAELLKSWISPSGITNYMSDQSTYAYNNPGLVDYTQENF